MLFYSETRKNKNIFLTQTYFAVSMPITEKHLILVITFLLNSVCIILCQGTCNLGVVWRRFNVLSATELTDNRNHIIYLWFVLFVWEFTKRKKTHPTVTHFNNHNIQKNIIFTNSITLWTLDSFINSNNSTFWGSIYSNKLRQTC